MVCYNSAGAQLASQDITVTCHSICCLCWGIWKIHFETVTLQVDNVADDESEIVDRVRDTPTSVVRTSSEFHVAGTHTGEVIGASVDLLRFAQTRGHYGELPSLPAVSTNMASAG